MNIQPEQVVTNKHYFDVAGRSETEDTCRVFMVAAKRYGRFELTQEELDEVESNGSFLWNGAVDRGYFEQLESGHYKPTQKLMGNLISGGYVEGVQF